jgi:hypothetical protein
MKTKKPKRYFDRDAKLALTALQYHREVLKSLKPHVPPDRIHQLELLLEFVEGVQDLILEDYQGTACDYALQAGMRAVRMFPQTLNMPSKKR